MESQRDATQSPAAATTTTPLTIVVVRHDAPNGVSHAIIAHIAEYVQESHAGPDAQSPVTLCGFPLSEAEYRYAPSRQAQTILLCTICRDSPNKRRRTPQYLGKPTRRAAPKLSTYTPDGRTAQAQRARASQYSATNPDYYSSLEDDARKRAHTRATWIRRERAAEDWRRNRRITTAFPQFDRLRSLQVNVPKGTLQ